MKNSPRLIALSERCPALSEIQAEQRHPWGVSAERWRVRPGMAASGLGRMPRGPVVNIEQMGKGWSTNLPRCLSSTGNLHKADQLRAVGARHHRSRQLAGFEDERKIMASDGQAG